MSEVNGNVSSLAKSSILPNLKTKLSSIPNSGLGVFSTTVIDVRFGPCRGRKVGLEDVADDTDTSYMYVGGEKSSKLCVEHLLCFFFTESRNHYFVFNQSAVKHFDALQV